ncbi:hypothetical protein [Dyadobacter luticola]|uniref:Uncharacterized protein n=1 Tax=Dyadobacter luticola TaxID=1979387 RepID=A0A5R9L5B5_9BACT|nr:hypothetical protein [Dyadobacter luticola]TLV03763.1 hypothetical protein FEN17_09265 [Dyadobacter luticola]
MDDKEIQAETRLPKVILEKAIRSNNEFGWKQIDFLQVVETARKLKIATIGGQVQYLFPDGTCELYWLNYDSEGRQTNEGWIEYCNRTAKECTDRFNRLISTINIQKEAITSFSFIAGKEEAGININDHLFFILYFDDKETNLFADQ